MGFPQKKKPKESENKDTGAYSGKSYGGGAFAGKTFGGGAFSNVQDDHNLTSSLFSGVKELEDAYDGKLLIGVGSTGDYVKKIQHALNMIYKGDPKYVPLREEKDFGPKTLAVVSRYQRDHKLVKGKNGVVGDETIGCLDQEISMMEIAQFAPSIAPPPSNNAQFRPATQKEENKFISKDTNSLDPYFFGQTATNPSGLKRQIPTSAIPLFNENGQVLAYFVDNKKIKGLFIYMDEHETWTRQADGKTDFDLYEDSLMRRTEPWSWGAHKAAHDIGGMAIQFGSHPIDFISGLWEGIKGLKDLDVDATWERIKNMDATDVSYVMTTLFLGKIGGAGKGGVSLMSATGSVAKAGIKYFEEIYRFLQKSKTAVQVLEVISNAQLYDALRGIASSKLGKALKAAGELGKKGFAAHHIIPVGLIKDTRVGNFIRKAYDSYWEINGEKNGAWVRAAKGEGEFVDDVIQHSGNHKIYTERVVKRIQSYMEKAGPNVTGADAKKILESLSMEIKTAIKNNPGVNINDLIF